MKYIVSTASLKDEVADLTSTYGFAYKSPENTWCVEEGHLFYIFGCQKIFIETCQEDEPIRCLFFRVENEGSLVFLNSLSMDMEIEKAIGGTVSGGQVKTVKHGDLSILGAPDEVFEYD